MKKLSAAVFAALLTACGSSGDPSGTVDGSIQGRKLDFSHGIIFTTGNQPGRPGNSATILLSNRSDLCDSMKSHIIPKNLDKLDFNIVHSDEQRNAVPLTTGEYIVATGSQAHEAPRLVGATASRSDGECVPVLDYKESQAVSGSVTLDAVDVDVATAGGAQGSYELFFGSKKEKLSGTFNAIFCEDATRPASGPKLECEP